MNVYRFLDSSINSVYSSNDSVLYIRCPDDCVLDSSRHLRHSKFYPIIISNIVETKLSFPSAAGSITGCSILIHRIKIGKSDKDVYVHPVIGMERDSSGHFHIIYIIGKATQDVGYVAHLSKQFILDTKTIWYNGIKNQILGYAEGVYDLKIVVEDDIDKYIVNLPRPTSINYQDDISKFLKSEEAYEYVGASQ